jgi:putative flippase GtrA
MQRWKQLILLYRYGISGVSSFLLELGVLYVAVQICGLSYLVAVPLAFVLTTVAQYGICHWWVFRHSGRRMRLEYGYFFLILCSGLVWATLLVALFVQTLGLNVYEARALAGVFTGLWDFYLNARFNFRAHAFLRSRG